MNRVFRVFGVSLLFCTFGLKAGTLLDRVAAVVGDEPILLSDIQEFRAELKKSPALANIYRIPQDKSSDKDLLNRMIEDRIITQSARALDAEVTNIEVDNQIQAIAKQNGISKAQLEASLKREGIAVDAYKKNIRAQLERRNVLEREIRRSGGPPSDAELRDIYEKSAKVEYKISLASFSTSTLGAAKSSEFKKLLSDLNASKIESKVGAEKLGAEDLGWLELDSVHPEIKKAVSKAPNARAHGPLKFNGQTHYVVVFSSRKGSDEDFQKRKDEMMGQIQGQDFERRFGAWVERKKKELNVLINI